MKTELIRNLKELLASRYYDGFIGDKLGNNLWINDPKRAERIHQAAENGCDGSTHGERIDDMRECNDLAEKEVYRPMFREMGFGEGSNELATALRESIDSEIDDCYAWHEKNGSLNQSGI